MTTAPTMGTLEQGAPSSSRRTRLTSALCGSDSGYYHHRRTLNEEACDWCKLAHSEAERRRRARVADEKARAEKARLHNRDAEYIADYRAARELGHEGTIRTVRISEYLVARLYDAADPATLAQLDAELGAQAVDRAARKHAEPDQAAATRAAELVRRRLEVRGRGRK